MKILTIIVIALVLLLILALAAGIGLSLYVIKPVRPDLAGMKEREREKSSWGNFDEYPNEKWDITSFDGYVLHGELLKNKGDNYVIITHGYCANRYGSVKYANMFYQLGFNVYIYDLRYFGDNKKTFCSMSYLESKDVIAVKDALQERFGKNITIGLHGESLGCATSITALGMYSGFSFCVADCGFADLTDLLKYQAGLMKMPGWVVYLTVLPMYLAHHYSFTKVKPVNGLKENKTPILFIYGDQDKFIPTSHTRMLFEACSAPKEIVRFEGAEHADSFYKDPERYTKVVSEFLENPLMKIKLHPINKV